MAETVGSLVDKISIVELKIYHMGEQLRRTDATPEHKETCQKRIQVMIEQRDDLSKELSELMEGVFSGRNKLKVYRQFKMYNDPIYATKK